jgi:tRNA threonylcarbamoyladenosine biosynthesis protein TsaB
MRILALDAALGACAAGVIADGVVLAQAMRPVGQGQAGALAAMAASVLASAAGKNVTTGLDAVAVTVGPGSFTGIRAALALAHGIGLARAIPVIGVSVGEALGAILAVPDGWTLWTAVDSRRGRVFLERAGGTTPDGGVIAAAVDALPVLGLNVALAGDAAAAVAAFLAARGTAVMLTAARLPSPLGIALAAAARQAGRLAPREAQPLYVDPPAVKLPATPPRPPPGSPARNSVTARG